MAGSPRRIFRNFSTEQIQQLIQSGFDRALNGQFTNLSGQGHSSQVEYMSLEDMLFEANYELGVRGVGARNLPTVIYQQFSQYQNLQEESL